MKISQRGRLVLALLTAAVTTVAIAAAVWSRPPRSAPGVGGILELLPPGSVLHSFMRVEMNSRPPQEVAVVAGVPQMPGSAAYTYVGFILAYDPWRHRFARVHAEALPGEVPLSVDGGRLIGGRDAAVFAAAHDNGDSTYRVVAMPRRTFAIVHSASVAGRAVAIDPFLIELVRGADGPPRQRILAWDGQRFKERTDTGPVPLPPQGRTWYYGVRNGEIKAPASVVHLQVRQPLRVTGTGPGRPGAIVIPDPRLDLVESGYRARYPGSYRIRVLLPLRSTETGFTLTLIVGDQAP